MIDSERDSFRAEVVEVLRREVPEDLEWLRWDEIPRMRWQCDGSVVEDVIPKGWLVEAAQRTEPVPDDTMTKRAALFDRTDAAAFGAWLLRLWIAHDTSLPELTPERRVELRGMAARAAELARRMGRGGTDPEERYRQLLAQEDHRPAPTSLPYRGLLAVVAACADPRVAADVEHYISAWQGERPARCRALQRMLSWIAARERHG